MTVFDQPPYLRTQSLSSLAFTIPCFRHEIINLVIEIRPQITT